MRLYFRLLLALSCLTNIFADVMNVNVNGPVSGNVNVFVLCTSSECGDAQGSFVSNGFSVSGTNTELGTFTKSGQASAADPGGRFASVFVQFQQTTETTATSLAVLVQTTATVDSLGGQWSVQGDLFNHYSLGFTLTTESLVQMTASDRGNLAENQQISLEGPQGPIAIQFDGSAEPFLMLPGLYTLQVLDDSPDFGVGPPGGSVSSKFSLNADFSPIVPEPRWGALVVVSLAILGGIFSRPRLSSLGSDRQIGFAGHDTLVTIARDRRSYSNPAFVDR